MRASFQENSVRKGPVQIDPNWDSLLRDDIYRQRILGTESGASKFISMPDKRKLTVLSLLVYLVFIVFTCDYIWSRIHVSFAYEVNTAIETSLKSKSYENNPQPRFWDDIETMEDLKSWLQNAFPRFLTPEVQGFNFPVGTIRFTLRRIKESDNIDKRFQSLSPKVWESKNGIPFTETSDVKDNQTAFGAYREWRMDAQLQIALNWNQLQNGQCKTDGAAQLLDLLEEVRYSEAEVTTRCKEWCEGLSQDGKPCRCWTLSGKYKCEFYYMPEDQLSVLTSDYVPQADRATFQTDPLTLRPPLETVKGSTAFWPTMKRFPYSSGKGWGKTPGFVMSLATYSKHLKESYGILGKTRPAPTEAKVVFNQVRDWIQGGMLSGSAAALSIDFVTYNPNCEVFNWIQLHFQQQASGHVTKRVEPRALYISAEERGKDMTMWQDLRFQDVLYVILVIIYTCAELWELGHRGIVKYFSSWWNWLTMITLALQWTTLISRYVYLKSAKFTKAMRDIGNIPNGDLSGTVEPFVEQASAFVEFNFFASLNLLFLWLQLVHYLNDIFPRVGVLVDTMYRAWTPVVFLFVIIADVLIGFVMWANLMFGKSLYAFKDFTTTVMSCTEMLFGQVDAYYELREAYPVSGLLFFFVYMFIFFIVLQNLSKAVVLLSYDDASEKYELQRKQEERRRAAESDSSSDYLAKVWKMAGHHVQRFFSTKHDKSRKSGRAESVERFQHQKVNTVMFIVLIAMYVIMTYEQVQIYWANTLTTSVSAAVKDPTFAKINKVSGQISSANSFATIESKRDVMLFLTEVLPQTFFDSSQGNLEGQENPLKKYASALPEEFPQLVINNWNIIVGRDRPVRISTRFSQTESLSSDSIGAFLPTDTRKAKSTSWIDTSATVFQPELIEVTSLGEIVGNTTRDFLQRRCKYSFAYGAYDMDKPNGWSCMLPPSKNEMTSILSDMKRQSFITSQTATVAVDFVIYNGYAEAFAYFAIVFGFQPSGAISKDIVSRTLRLDLYNSRSIFRLLLEIGVIILTGVYLIQSGHGIYKAVLELKQNERRDGSTQSGRQKMLCIIRAVVLHLFLDPFNLLDLVSSIMTVITMVLWYDIVFMRLRDFYLPEKPVWDSKQGASDWKSDDEVLFAFAAAGRKIALFYRVCAINTVIMFFRMLKYLQVFSRMRLMFRTLIRGSGDIFWFILLMMVFLMGYVTMGNQLFGVFTYGFSTVGNSVVTCFEMFLGTFNYTKLRRSDTMVYIFYSYTYMVLLRYLLINMFFAIIDKSFILEDMERKRLKDESIRKSGRQRRSNLRGTWDYVRMLVHGKRLKPAHSVSSLTTEITAEDEMMVAAPSAIVDGDPGAQGEGVSAAATHSSTEVFNSDRQVGSNQLVLAEADVDTDVHPGVIRRARNWRYLPPDMQEWALATAKTIYKFILELQRRREDAEREHVQPYELDRILEAAESDIKAMRVTRGKAASDIKRELENEELKKLKEIHQDQESLAWYIMKREAELKKLEQMKNMKQDRFDKMVQAAKSLISTDEVDGAKGDDRR